LNIKGGGFRKDGQIFNNGFVAYADFELKLPNINIHENEFSWTKIYPNPFSESFTIEADEQVKVSIYDAVGRMVSELELFETLEISTENWDPGI
jgi:hypothetical protein